MPPLPSRAVPRERCTTPQQTREAEKQRSPFASDLGMGRADVFKHICIHTVHWVGSSWEQQLSQLSFLIFKLPAGATCKFTEMDVIPRYLFISFSKAFNLNTHGSVPRGSYYCSPELSL